MAARPPPRPSFSPSMVKLNVTPKRPTAPPRYPPSPSRAPVTPTTPPAVRKVHAGSIKREFFTLPRSQRAPRTGTASDATLRKGDRTKSTSENEVRIGATVINSRDVQEPCFSTDRLSIRMNSPPGCRSRTRPYVAASTRETQERTTASNSATAQPNTRGSNRELAVYATISDVRKKEPKITEKTIPLPPRNKLRVLNTPAKPPRPPPPKSPSAISDLRAHRDSGCPLTPTDIGSQCSVSGTLFEAPYDYPNGMYGQPRHVLSSMYSSYDGELSPSRVEDGGERAVDDSEGMGVYEPLQQHSIEDNGIYAIPYARAPEHSSTSQAHDLNSTSEYTSITVATRDEETVYEVSSSLKGSSMTTTAVL